MPSRLDALIDAMNERGATALHVVSGRAPHGRVKKELVVLRDIPVSEGEVDEMCAALLTPAQGARLASDRRITVVATRAGLRYRASLVCFGSALSAVLRPVPTRVPSLAELGCPEALWRVADGRGGLLLVVGPSGTGKTTTATALVDHVNKTRACHIVTIEDPIEVLHEPLRAAITQRELGAHTPDRATALREAAQDDVNVVYVADLCPVDALAVCELAAAGTLVIATMVASGVVDAIEQLVSTDASSTPGVRGLLSEALLGVVGQRVVEGAGSARAHVVVHEILLRSATVSTAIRDGHTPQLVSVMQSGAGAGMQTHDMALERLLQVGRITPETAVDAAADRERMTTVVQRVASRG
jgi:twitching motility protein PilT